MVDDDHDICALIQFKLKNAGHDVILEHDGEAGLAAARAERPDLAILDWMMPRLSGIELCLELRSDPDLEKVPVLLLTSKAQEADVERGFAAGADDYIVKPFSPRELVTRVEAALKRSVR